MTIDIQALADAIGYPAAALGILVESSGIPFPGETMLLAVAAWAAAGHLDIRIVILFGFGGALLGSDLGYLIGRLGGRPLVERFGRIFRINPGHLARTEMFFARHGAWALIASRFIVGPRTWASVLAGMSHMPFARFQVFSAIGGLAWAVLVGTAGYLLGSNWRLVEAAVKYLGLGGLALVVVVGATLYLYRRRARRR